MQNTNGSMRFGVLARQVFAWDSAIRWIALDEAGRRLQLEWRDRDIESTATGTTLGHPVTIDPLPLMLAESRQDICHRSDSADPQHLRFVVLAYGRHARVVTKIGRYGHLNVGSGLAGDPYRVGMRLAGLFDSTEDSRVDTHANVPERQREELRVCSLR